MVMVVAALVVTGTRGELGNGRVSHAEHRACVQACYMNLGLPEVRFSMRVNLAG